MEEKTKKSVSKEKKSQKKQISLAARILIRIVTILVAAVLGVTAGFFGFKRFTKVTKTTSYAMVEKQLSLCQELVTAKYRYSDIVTLKKSAAFAKSFSIIKYTGLIRGGIADITECDIQISSDGKQIKVKLPEPEILGNEVITMEVFDEQQSIFVPISTQEIFDEIQRSKDETLEDIIAEGFLKEAKNYAIRVITQVLQTSGFEQVEVD